VYVCLCLALSGGGFPTLRVYPDRAMETACLCGMELSVSGARAVRRGYPELAILRE